MLDHISLYLQKHITEKMSSIKNIHGSLSTRGTSSKEMEQERIDILQVIRQAEEDLVVNCGKEDARETQLNNYFGFGAYMIGYGIPPKVIHY